MVLLFITLTWTRYLGPRCNRGDGGGVGLSTCLCLHAEENALLEAGRERIREGAILYCDTYVQFTLGTRPRRKISLLITDAPA
jgi:hypothetical protein